MAASFLVEGLREMMDAAFKDSATPENHEIFLFSNDETITSATVDADLTEITTNGGAKQTLTKASWTAATDADPVVSRYNGSTGVVWTITGSLTVYGWAIRGMTSGKLYAAENFGTKTLVNGDSLTAAPIDLKADIP